MHNAEHRHDMRPIGGGVYRCTSCLFRCTAASVPWVDAHPESHRAVTRQSPKARRKVWDYLDA